MIACLQIGPDILSRRFVIQNYIHYDAKKKGGAIPSDLDTWDWSCADAIDLQLSQAGFKDGILAGYREWKRVQLTRAGLAQCAVEASIFPRSPRALGQLEIDTLFAWKPTVSREWFEHLNGGGDYPTAWPLILRPAIASERPAKWYVEDGSGRAICFFRALLRLDNAEKCAFGYLGVTPDPTSTFMRETFPELIANTAAT